MSTSESKSENNQVSSWEEELVDLYPAFMKGGECKESFTAFLNDCLEKKPTCTEAIETMCTCMEAHSYYQPFIQVVEKAVDHYTKDVDAFLESKSKETDALLTGGACIDSVKAWIHSREENGKNMERADMDMEETMRECMEAHSNYYQPFLKVLENGDEHLFKEMHAFLRKKRED